ncbi:MAG TPA: malonic semialdehyde reductase [Cellulomonas sp.]|nr:malonic semialdehyde reductase [Cellulomonas sp.]
MSELDFATDLDAAPLAIGDDVADLLFREARTVNAFADDEVPDGAVRAAYDLVRWGPTAMNAVPLRLLLVRTPEARARLAAHMNEGNRDRVLAAPLTIVAAADTDFHRHLGTLAPHAVRLAERFAGDTGSRTGLARQSGLIQVGYLITGLRAAGLHVGPMGGYDAAGIDTEFFTENGWQSLLVLNVGQPAVADATRPRGLRLTYTDVARTV